MQTTRAQDYDLPINVNKLGCIMLEFDPISLPRASELLDLGAPGSFVYDRTGEQPWVQGPVCENGSHATLLYGLVNVEDAIDDRRAGQEYRPYVDALLADLELVGNKFSITDLEVFENPAYDVVVGRLGNTQLTEANRRLRFLPHVDTFAEYKSHITLAYVTKGAGAGFADAIWEQVVLGSDLVGKAINYGGENIT